VSTWDRTEVQQECVLAKQKRRSFTKDHKAEVVDRYRKSSKNIEAVLTVLGGGVVYATTPFEAFVPTAFPRVIPDWSLIAHFGGDQNPESTVHCWISSPIAVSHELRRSL